MGKKSLREKLSNTPKKVIDKKTGKLMLVPSGVQIEALISKIPYGEVITISRLREQLAKQEGTEITCPLVTGIMLKLIAQAQQEGLSRAPWWRVVRDNWTLYNKFPGYPDLQYSLLVQEGWNLVPYRKTFKLEVNSM